MDCHLLRCNLARLLRFNIFFVVACRERLTRCHKAHKLSRAQPCKYIFFQIYSLRRPRFLRHYLYSITAPRTTLWGGPGPRFKLLNAKNYARSFCLTVILLLTFSSDKLQQYSKWVWKWQQSAERESHTFMNFKLKAASSTYYTYNTCTENHTILRQVFRNFLLRITVLRVKQC